MPDQLFISSVGVEDGLMLLGFELGTPVALNGATLRRELSGDRAEYAMTVSSGGDQFEVRVIADADGRVNQAIAAAQDIPEDWFE